MKAKKLWLIVFAIVMCLAACLIGCGDDTDGGPNALRITNKAELRADWFEGGEDRTIKLDVPPEISDKDVRVTSSNPSVIEAAGKTLKAKSAGIAKITVSADDESDSVTITVKPAPSDVTITNKDELGSIVVGESRTVEYSIKPDAFDADGAGVKITSSNTKVLSVNGKTVTAVAQGTATLTVSTFGVSDAVEVEVIALAAPEIDGELEVKGAINTDIALPVTALSCDGIDLREHVTATCSDGITFDNRTMTVRATEKGEHTVRLDVVDPRGDELTATATVTVTAYRNIFANVNGYGMVDLSAVSYEDGKQFVDDDEQVAFFDRWDGTWAAFDAAPGKTYYSEFTVNSTGKPDWSTFYGATHSVKTDSTRYLTGYIDRGAAETREPEYEGEEDKYRSGARAFRVKDFDFVNDSDCWEMHQGNRPRTQIIYADGIYRFRNIDKLDSFPCKIATARIGDFFYYFVNDDFVFAVTNKYFSDKDTVPGYFQQSGIKTDISNIVWLDGAAAKEKFDALTDNGSKLISEYAPESWWAGENEASEHITHSTATGDVNYSFDTDTLTGENKGIATPYIFFDGNFALEWEYTFDADTTAVNGDWNRYMGLEARHAHDDNNSWSANYGDKPAFLFGACRYDGDNGKVCATVKPFSKNKPNVWDPETPTRVEGSDDWFAFDGEMKLKFKVVRICTTDANNKPLAKYTFEISRPDGTQRSVWTYDDHGALNWVSPCEPVILLWKNRGVKGAYSNIKWSVPEQSIAITNKQELTARWAAGDPARTVGVQALGLGDVKVVSSDPEVISADGKTLTPVAAGTATITVSSDGFSDSVTITVIPALSQVTITNADALTAKWKDNSTDSRTVEISLAPAEHYTLENTQVTVTSSNTNVISVDGLTLSAVGAGKSTVTVTALGKTATVEITVTSTEPMLTLAGGVTEMYGATGEIALPAFTALSPDGEDLSESVQITCDSGATYDRANNTLTANATGTYTMSYELGQKSAVLTVYVYRKIFADASDKVAYIEDKDNLSGAGQQVEISEGFEYFMPFDMTAGKNYYAEVTFTGAAETAASNEYLFGMTHSVKDQSDRFVAAFYDRGGDGTFKVKNFDKTADVCTNIDQRTSATAVMFRENVKTVLQTGETGVFPVKFGVARVEDMFYCFVNDIYVMGFTDKYLGDKDTVAGVFVGAYKNWALDKSSIQTTLTGIDFQTYADGANQGYDKASENGKKLIGKYAPNTDWNTQSWGNASANFTATSDDNGLGFTYDDANATGNCGLVSPNIFFDGDFTVEWEYEWQSGDAGSWDQSKVMSFEVRGIYRDTGDPWQCKMSDNTMVQFGAQRVNNGSDANMKLFSYYKDKFSDANTSLAGKGQWYGAKMKFKVTRVCDTQNNSSTYTLTMSDASGGNPVTWTTTVSNGEFTNERPCDPVVVYWRNTRQQGAYTNIKWSASATQADNN